jgi:2'-5' RNA ligase
MEWMGLPGNLVPEVALSAPARQRQPWHDTDVFEYVLVIQPSGAVVEKLREEQLFFQQVYDKQGTVRFNPQIKVAGFRARESMEATIIRWMQNICSLQKSFPITFNNYSGFPTGSIHLRIMEHEPFHQLTKELTVVDDFIKSSGFPQMRMVSKPHMTIASKLDQRIYEKAMVDFSQKCFFESFIANELVLVKRKNAFEKGKVVNVFGLMPANNQL